MFNLALQLEISPPEVPEQVMVDLMHKGNIFE